MFVHFGLIIVFIAIQESNGEESCWTPPGIKGECISIYECSPLINLLRVSENLSPKDKMTIRDSQCGFEGDDPKVCCPGNMRMSKPAIAPKPIEMKMDLDPGVVPALPNILLHPKLGLINRQNCGPFSESKILLGNKTTVLEFPWMALIAYTINRRTTDFRCAGSLINERYVLTAAHCVSELNDGVVLAGVRIGEHNLTTEIDCDYEDDKIVSCADKYQNFFIENVHVHSGYKRAAHENDIALIRLNGRANFTIKNIKPICLPIGNPAMLEFKKGIVTGWGKTEENIRSTELLKVKLEIVPNDECARIYKESKIHISHKQICAGGQSRMDSCAGDSGGPLQYPVFTTRRGPKYFQYGLVSFGPETCGSIGYPGVYTRIAYYVDWILNTIHE